MWSEVLCRTHLFETVAEKYLSSDVSTVLFTDKKKTFTVLTPKTPKNHQLYATAAPRRKASPQNICAHNVETVTDGISRRVTSGEKHQFDTYQSQNQSY